jgi:hypothetical protein
MSHEHHRHLARRDAQRRASVRRWIGLSVLLACAACGKTPAVLWAHVYVDDGVPPISDLRTSVVSLSHPDLEPVVQRQILVMGDAAHAAPFAFPVAIPITLNAEYAGDVTLTVSGLERDTEAVIASGEVATAVVTSKTMHVAVVMSLVAPAGAPPAP